MKYDLRDYFYDRLSADEEEEVQKQLCDIKDTDKEERLLRDLFDECMKSPRQQRRPRGSRALVWTCTLSSAVALALLVLLPLTYRSGKAAGENRTVFMDGEAYLDVAKNPECPFVIKSQNVDIKVLGTSFNFRNFAQERTAELLLMEGSVEASLTGQDNVVRLKPGDRLCYDREAGRDIRKKLN